MSCSKNVIGERIAALRNSRELSQQELSAALHVSREVVAKWENGTRDLKTEHTVALSDYFGVSCDYILRGVEAEKVDIHKLTGLSENAMNSLSFLKVLEREKWLSDKHFKLPGAGWINNADVGITVIEHPVGHHASRILNTINYTLENGQALFLLLTDAWHDLFKLEAKIYTDNVANETFATRYASVPKSSGGEHAFTNSELKEIYEYRATKELARLTKNAQEHFREYADFEKVEVEGEGENHATENEHDNK